jgi:hypothetical protein
MLKAGVRLRGVSPEMVVGHTVVAQVFADHGMPWIITSANDSKHGDGSQHGSGNALDYRMKHLPLVARSPLVDQVAAALGAAMQSSTDTRRVFRGQEFDVLWEAIGSANEHLHAEYQPKAST